MGTPCAMTAGLAKTDTDKVVGEARRGCRLNDSVMQISRDLFPLKTALHLSDATGYSVRTCERWLNEDVVLPAPALASLIQSEWGREYLAAVMVDSTPRWWLAFKALLKRISYDAQQALQAKRYKEILDEEAAVARAYPSSPMFQDDPFYEGQPAPASPMVRRTRR